jgi:hypothetical protein
MSLRLTLIGVLVALLTSACQGIQPTLLIMEVTREVPVTVIVTAEPTPGPLSLNTPTPSPTPQGTPFASPTPSATPTVDPFPTPVVGQIFIADQSFERGRMFWLQPVDQIWVLTINANGERAWQVFNDTFEEGMMERDPSIVPPLSGNLTQPERGFGKLWRETPQLREQLGWAIGNELGYTTRYEYQAGGIVNEQGVYEPGSGIHIIETLNNEVFYFYEGLRTWEVKPAR